MLCTQGQQKNVALKLTVARAEGLRQHMRHSFEVQRTASDPYAIKFALSDGREQLKKWRESISMQC